MMAHYDWKGLFPPHILRRGLDYYHDGHILTLQHHENTTIAEIEGTDIYTVSVTRDPKTNNIKDHSCDCPYGADGTPCKHLAALLFALEEEPLSASINTAHKPSFEEIVDLLSEKQMKSLLIRFAQNDTYVWEIIKLTATNKLSQTQKLQWRLDLTELTDLAADRHGFIDYEEAYSYCLSLCEYLDDRIPNLLISELIEDAFELTCLVFQTALTPDIDDSDGGLSILAAHCIDAWSQILEATDANTQKKMHQWFTEFYTTSDIGQILLDDYIYTAPWKKELASELLHFLDQQLHKSLRSPVKEYRFNKLIVHRIHWMEQSGASEKEIDAYMDKYHHLPAVRDLQISQAISSGDYKVALTLLDESQVIDKNLPGLVAKYSSLKIKVYELMNDISALKKELTSYVFTFHQPDLSHIEKLKVLLSPSEWKDMLPQLLNSPSMHLQACPLLAKERMHEQLLARIEMQADIHLLQAYEPMLKKEFPLRCMNIYISHLQQAMDRAYSRKSYWSVIQTLKKLRKYPDGEIAAQNLANRWKEKYPRRSSMLDELKKAGF